MDTFLLSHGSTRHSHQGENGAGYQQAVSIHLVLLGFLIGFFEGLSPTSMRDYAWLAALCAVL
jgi:hypothetical protein